MIYSHFSVIFSSSPQQESTARIALQLHADEEAQAQLQVAAGRQGADGNEWNPQIHQNPQKSSKIHKRLLAFANTSSASQLEDFGMKWDCQLKKC